MSRRWVANASPLILLEKVDQLRLLRDLADELIVPDGVAQEVRVKPQGERLLDDLLSFSTARIESNVRIPQEIEVWDLGRGESEVLTLTVRTQGSRAVLDDLEARRCAQALGVGVIGTLGVVLRAKHRDLIPAARPVITRLRQTGLYVADELVERVLAHLGE